MHVRQKDVVETRRLIQESLADNAEFIPMASKYYCKVREEALDRDKVAVSIM